MEEGWNEKKEGIVFDRNLTIDVGNEGQKL